MIEEVSMGRVGRGGRLGDLTIFDGINGVAIKAIAC
jgi:hypothetical protein